jgi:hypothetical protein
VNDYAIDVDSPGPATWEMDVPQLPKEHSDASDELRQDATAPEWVKDWSGPFEVDYEVIGAPTRWCVNCDKPATDGCVQLHDTRARDATAPTPAVIVVDGPDGPMLQVTQTGKLTADEARMLARALDAKVEEIEPTPHADAYRKTAMTQTTEGVLEVDADARISDGAEDGAYVEAWIWVGMEDAGIATRCDECDAMIPCVPAGGAEGGMENRHHAESCSLFNAEKE